MFINQCHSGGLGSRSQKGHPVHFTRPSLLCSKYLTLCLNDFVVRSKISLLQRQRRWRRTKNIKSTQTVRPGDLVMIKNQNILTFAAVLAAALLFWYTSAGLLPECSRHAAPAPAPPGPWRSHRRPAGQLPRPPTCSTYGTSWGYSRWSGFVTCQKHHIYYSQFISHQVMIIMSSKTWCRTQLCKSKIKFNITQCFNHVSLIIHGKINEIKLHGTWATWAFKVSFHEHPWFGFRFLTSWH